MNALRYGVFAGVLFSIVLLAVQVFRTFSFGSRPLYSKAQGKPWKGILYAFGRGMTPWEKESAARHLPTYLAGIAYHSGIFATLLYVLLKAWPLAIPKSLMPVFSVSMAVGFFAGSGLLLKRILKSRMRFLSCPDDYVANILVDLFILSGLVCSRLTAACPGFFILAILTFFYIPLGKIRHCFFFFYSRILFGSYFGRRGLFVSRKSPQA